MQATGNALTKAVTAAEASVACGVHAMGHGKVSCFKRFRGAIYRFHGEVFFFNHR